MYKNYHCDGLSPTGQHPHAGRNVGDFYYYTQTLEIVHMKCLAEHNHHWYSRTQIAVVKMQLTIVIKILEDQEMILGIQE